MHRPPYSATSISSFSREISLKMPETTMVRPSKHYGLLSFLLSSFISLFLDDDSTLELRALFCRLDRVGRWYAAEGFRAGLLSPPPRFSDEVFLTGTVFPGLFAPPPRSSDEPAALLC